MMMRKLTLATALAAAMALPAMAEDVKTSAQALPLDGVTCTNVLSYYCASQCSQCSPLGGFSCTGKSCYLSKGVKSGELHWSARTKN